MTGRLVRALTAIAGVQACAGLAGGLGRASSLAALAAGYWASTWRSRSARDEGAHAAPEEMDRAAGPWPSLGIVLFGVTLALALGERLLAAASRSGEPYDALSYHLVLPLGWLRTGALGVVPLPFGDPAPAYAPASPELLGATLVAVSGRLHAAQLAQWPFLGLGAVAVAEEARRRRAPAWVAAALALLFVSLPELYQQATAAMADVALSGALLAATVLLSADIKSRDGWLALGLAAGCKSVGVPLAVLAGGVLCGLSLLRAKRAHAGPPTAPPSLAPDAPMPRRLLGGLATRLVTFSPCLVAFLAGGGFWLVRAAWTTGNPLFPIALLLGPARGGCVVWNGFYTPADMRAWLYHVPIREIENLVAMVRDQGLGYLAVLLGSLAVDRRKGSTIVLAVGAASVGLWIVLPYQEPRFFLPVWSLGVLLAGGVRWHDSRRGLALLCGGVGCAWLSPVVPARWVIAGLGLVVALAAAIATALLTHRRPFPWRPRLPLAGPWRERLPLLGLGTAMMAWLSVACWAPAPSLALRADLDEDEEENEDDSRTRGEAQALEAAWRWLDQHGGNLPVYYAGTNLVGPLAGPAASRALHTLNAAGERDRPLHTYPRPAALGQRILSAEPSPDREGADERAWLAALCAGAPAWLYVARLGPSLAATIAHDQDGFPVERAFADRHPDRLPIAHASAFVRIYRAACGGTISGESVLP
jgi:hypothetical protein